MIYSDNSKKKILPRFRESAYTKVKQVVGEETPKLREDMEKKIEVSANAALDKRKKIIDKLGLTEEQIKITMNDFSKKEWDFIPHEAQCFGVVPQAFQDLSSCIEVKTVY